MSDPIICSDVIIDIIMREIVGEFLIFIYDKFFFQIYFLGWWNWYIKGVIIVLFLHNIDRISVIKCDLFLMGSGDWYEYWLFFLLGDYRLCNIWKFRLACLHKFKYSLLVDLQMLTRISFFNFRLSIKGNSLVATPIFLKNNCLNVRLIFQKWTIFHGMIIVITHKTMESLHWLLVE